MLKEVGTGLKREVPVEFEFPAQRVRSISVAPNRSGHCGREFPPGAGMFIRNNAGEGVAERRPMVIVSARLAFYVSLRENADVRQR